jgi:hypothetical protein
MKDRFHIKNDACCITARCLTCNQTETFTGNSEARAIQTELFQKDHNEAHNASVKMAMAKDRSVNMLLNSLNSDYN